MIKQYLNTFFLKNPLNLLFHKKPDANLQILMYHRILNPGEMDFLSGLGMVHTTTANFEDHLKWFSLHQYNCISFNELSEIMSGGNRIPPKTIILTFDDGSVDQYRNAVPLLKKYDCKATFFPIKNFVYNNGLFWLIEFYVYLNELGITRVREILQDLPKIPGPFYADERLPGFNRANGDSIFQFKYLFSVKSKETGLERLRKESSLTDNEITAFCQRSMNPDQIKDLVKEGFEIGSHGVHHYPMSCLTKEEKSIEIDTQWIEQLQHGGKKIFSLPFGSHSQSDFALLEKYDFVLTTKHETYNYGNCGRELGRFAVLDETAKKLSKRLIK
jgi:peptidoglycan/xylan/chitin deacetylase (PgdA/CDA1 family)